MELFNQYQNKCFEFLKNYINESVNNSEDALDYNQFEKIMKDEYYLTDSEFISILNEDVTGKNMSTFFERGEKIQSVRQNSIPIIASESEKIWLKHILNDDKCKYFIDDEIIDKLKEKLTSYEELFSEKYIDILNDKNIENMNKNVSFEYIEIIKTIKNAIDNENYLIITNKTFDGKLYENQKVVPYKIEYYQKIENFSLSCWPLISRRAVKMNIKNMLDVKIGEKIEDYNKYYNLCEDEIKNTLQEEEIILEILEDSQYAIEEILDQFIVINKNYVKDKKLLSIQFHSFQKDDIVKKILILGKKVKVISPKEVVLEIKTNYEKLQAYYSDFK